MIRIICALSLLIALSGCQSDEMADGEGELDLAIQGGTNHYASYEVVVATADTGALLLEQIVIPPVSPDGVVMPVDLVALLPAGTPLFLDVIARDSANLRVGAGTGLLTLVEGQVTQAAIDVVAMPSAPANLDVTLNPINLPVRDLLVANPGSAVAGSTQEITARVIDAATGSPVLEAINLADAVAPMFFPQDDGTVVSTFPWPYAGSGSTYAHAAIGYLDPQGRGWGALAEVTFQDNTTPAPVSLEWNLLLAGSGWLDGEPGRRYVVALGGPLEEFQCNTIVFVDADGDGKFTYLKETAGVELGLQSRVFFAATPTYLTGGEAPDLAGALADTNSDGAIDTILSVRSDGTIAQLDWPLGGK